MLLLQRCKPTKAAKACPLPRRLEQVHTRVGELTPLGKQVHSEDGDEPTQRPRGTSGLVFLSQGPCKKDDLRTKTHGTKVKKEEVGCEHYFTTQRPRTKPSTPGQQPAGRSRVPLPGEAMKETGQGGHSWRGALPIHEDTTLPRDPRHPRVLLWAGSA